MSWHGEFQRSLDSNEEKEKEMDGVLMEFNGMAYCEDCLCIVGETDECLCLVERNDFVQSVLDRARGVESGGRSNGGCGRTDRKCCGGNCGV